MGELPGAVPEKLQICPKAEPERGPAARAPARRLYAALVAGDLPSLQVLTDRYYEDVNLVFEISQDELEWQVKSRASYGLSGLWSLEYKRELSTPLLLPLSSSPTGSAREGGSRSNSQNPFPGEDRASRGSRSRLTQSLWCQSLSRPHPSPQLVGAEPQSPPWASSPTSAPSLRRCAKLLLKHGAAVDLPAEDTGDTALHVAARHCLYEHAQLYLAHGARVDRRNALEETPLSACGQANHRVARFLLRRGADVNALDYDGLSPLGCVLRAAPCKQELRPHLCVQVLLNHGSQKIWPGAFVKVLKSCAAVPEIIEILFNSYSQIPVAEKWAEAVPEEVFQRHLTFYESLFRLSGTARCLQHLCRFAIRKEFGSKCHRLIPSLPVPRPLRDYLLLEPEGVVL
ncbi:ASB18 protein, partial [Casuarius casuarius]|nr:ASB18 protein [Casuarius casuarius]